MINKKEKESQIVFYTLITKRFIQSAFSIFRHRFDTYSIIRKRNNPAKLNDKKG